jgi:hypothetical protein
MRFGVLISIVSHVIFVALALLGTPKLFDEAATRPIEVELVRSEDAPPEQPEEKPPEKQEDSKAETAKEPGKPEKDKPAPWNPLPDQTVASPPPKPDPATKPDPAAKPNDQQAAAQTQQPQGLGQSSQPQPAQPQASQPAQSSIFDPVNIPKLLNLPNAPDSGFDSESMTAANISEDQKAAFKAHLRKCWKLPGTVSSPATRVVMRVYFRRDGTLASEPVLIEASASRDGPVVMQTAIRALKECQPYGFLPADKYREWKVLDLSFTPRDMAGG